MSTCKECLNEELCEYYLKETLYFTGRSLSEMLNADKCRFFKDRSKFIELHCKLGDVVYHYCEELHEILDYTVYCINLFRDNGITYQADAYDEENAESLSDIGFEPEDIGRDVFLTREEAEQALRESEVNER